MEYTGIRLHNTIFKLKEYDKYYYIFAIRSRLNENRIFDGLVEEGDSIIKPAYSDTLIVKKNGKEYRYTFWKRGLKDWVNDNELE